MADQCRPWMKFSPHRWRNDEALRMCGAAARGLWVELMCIMHDAEPYGHLLVKGKKPSDKLLAVMTGIPIAEVPELLAELEENEVFSRTDDGIVFSRGMVRDDEIYQKNSKYGKKGAAAKARKEKAEKAALRGGLSGGQRDASRIPERGGQGLEIRRGESPPIIPPKVAEAKKQPIPDNWQPEPFGEDSQAHRISSGWSQERFATELENFRSYHRMRSNRFADWQDAWGNWVRNTVKFAERDQRERRSGFSDGGFDLVEQINANPERWRGSG